MAYFTYKTFVSIVGLQLHAFAEKGKAMDKPTKPSAPIAFGIPMSESQAMRGRYISGGVDGVLAKLFNLICLELTNGTGIGPIQWNKLMIDYIRKISSSKIPIDRSSIRGNINKALRQPGMTWNVFATKGLLFLKMDCFSFTVNAVFEDGTETCSTISASFSQDSKYKDTLPKDKYINPQGKQSKVTRSGAPAKGGISYAKDGGGMLARMFNTICLDMTNGKGFTELQWNKMLDEYIDAHAEGKTSADRQSTRSNHKKDFRRGKMMWKVFCKGLRFLKVQQALITIECVREDGKRVTVDTNMVFSSKA